MIWILLGGDTDLKNDYSLRRQTEKDLSFPLKRIVSERIFRKKKWWRS